MRIGWLSVTGLLAGCAATSTNDAARPAGLDDVSFGDAALCAVQTPDAAPAPADSAAAVDSVTGTGAWRAAGDDNTAASEIRPDAKQEEKGMWAWLHKGRASAEWEERLVGANEQPEWTTHRRFTTTQAYVLAPGQIMLEQWVNVQTPRGEGPRQRFQTEISMGLGERFEVDLYENWGRVHGLDGDAHYKHVGVQAEVRYALAKWGKIPLNPTLVGGYIHVHNGPDAALAKILLATDFGGGGWHWAANFGVVRGVQDPNTTDLQATMGISRTICDGTWSIGLEGQFDSAYLEGDHDDPENQLLVGPSLQWRPTESIHLDIVPLFGIVTSERRDPRMELQVILGIDLGPEQETLRQRESRPVTN